jgi:hypothetical protein
MHLIDQAADLVAQNLDGDGVHQFISVRLIV